MAISKKSITTGTDNGGTATVSVTTSESPSATASGDLVVIVYTNDYYTLATMGTPSATGTPTMNAITGATGDGGTNVAHIKGYWYVANTSGAQTISATETGSHDEEKALIAYVLGGADTTTPVDAAASGTGTSASNVAASVSPTTSDAFLIAVAGSGGGAFATSYTTPAPLTEDGEIHNGGQSAVYASTQLAASGATGTYTFTASGSIPYASCTIAIKTAAGGGAAVPPSLVMAPRWN